MSYSLFVFWWRRHRLLSNTFCTKQLVLGQEKSDILPIRYRFYPSLHAYSCSVEEGLAVCSIWSSISTFVALKSYACPLLCCMGVKIHSEKSLIKQLIQPKIVGINAPQLTHIISCVTPDRSAVVVLPIKGCDVCYIVISFAVLYMMTSSNGNIFRVTGSLCEKFTGPRWIPRTKASDAELWCFPWSASE